MQLKKFIVILTMFICSNVFASDKLIFSIDIIRHGDRTPIMDIPNSSYHWNEGLGELTAEGKQQEYTNTKLKIS